MNNKKEIEWIITEIAPGMAKIEASPLGRIPTFEEFKQKARELLSNSEKINNNSLRDETRSQDLGEALLLHKELENLKNIKLKKIHEVMFTTGNNTIMANSKTIDKIVEKKEVKRMGANEFGANPDIIEQVLEGYER